MPSFTNQATLSYNGNVTVSNIVTGEVVAVLTVTKTALSGAYGADDIITYVISLVNSGTTPYTGLTVTDNLGAYTYGTGTLVPLTYVADSLRYFVNGILQTTPTPTGTQPLTVSGISVPAGGNALVMYEARINDFAPLGVQDCIVNTVSVTGGGLLSPVEARAQVCTRDAACLTICKAVNPSRVPENGTLTYTFTIQNYGNTAAVATDDVVVSDTFTPILNPISVTYDGTLWTEGTQYTYQASTGEFATVAGMITVPAATFARDPATGAVTVIPGVRTLTVTGTV